MRKIGPKNSKQELFIRKIIRTLGHKPYLHDKGLPGSPDLSFPKIKKVIFINGCFWHGHKGCKRALLPSTNKKFWQKKILGNKNRDKLNYKKLHKLGWQYLTIWQCQIKANKKQLIVGRLNHYLSSQKRKMENGARFLKYTFRNKQTPLLIFVK